MKPGLFGRDALADWPAGVPVALACVLVLVALLLADMVTPPSVTVGSLGVIVAMAAGFVVSRRLVAAVVVVGVATRLAAIPMAHASALTALAQTIALAMGGVVAYLAAQALRAQGRHAQEMARLSAIVAAARDLAAASLSSSDLVAQLLLYSVQITGADRGDVTRIEGDDMIVEAAFDSRGLPVETGSRRKISSRPIVVDLLETQRTARGAPERDVIAVPLVVEGTVQGVLTLIASSQQVFEDVDIAAVEQVATIAALALHGSRLFAEAQRSREEAEAAAARLRESQRGLAEAQQLVHLGSWQWDLVRNRVIWSDEMFRIFGQTPHARSLTNEAYLDYVHPDDREFTRNALEEARRLAKPFAFEHRIFRSDGSVRTLQAEGTVQVDGQGRPLVVSGSLQDITERKHAEALVKKMTSERENELVEHARRMEALEKVKSEFLLLASHELRGPLSVLTGYISLLEDEALGQLPRPSRDALRIMSEKTAAMTRMIEDLLQTARLEQGLELDLKPLDLRDVARESVRSSSGPRNAQRIATRLPSHRVPVNGDRDRLVIIVNGLLDNALKYAGPEADISCDVSSDSGWAAIAVRDSGPGISSEDMPKLFTRFGRIVTSQNAHISGTGLGLYLSQNIARMHGGRITVESEVGKGTTFTLRLPLAARGETSPARGLVSKARGSDN